jgi:hypothetical protein
MKVIFITPVTPYKENMGGPSGHPYALMIERDPSIEIEIYSFNNNHFSSIQIAEVEKELNVKIQLLETPSWIQLILKFHLAFIRFFLKFPINYYIRLPKDIVNEINIKQPDLLWVYSQEFSGIIKQFKGQKILFTVPDCYSLHWYRRLGKRFTLKNGKFFTKDVINYYKHYRMESNYECSSNIRFHLVGEEDAKFLKEICPNADVHFYRHPHYEIHQPMKEIKFSSPKIKLLIAGRYDIYSYQAADEVIQMFCQHPEILNNYELTILGKGWEQHVGLLKNHGCQVNLITFAPNYIEEIVKHDIQLNPLSLGTGTKGKVLDAITNGLLEIGTYYALENIAVENNVSCIQYENIEQLLHVLQNIPLHREKYETIAKEGRKNVLKYHDNALISTQLFE